MSSVEMPETKVLFFQETVTNHVRPVSTPSVEPLPQQAATAHTPSPVSVPQHFSKMDARHGEQR